MNSHLWTSLWLCFEYFGSMPWGFNLTHQKIRSQFVFYDLTSERFPYIMIYIHLQLWIGHFTQFLFHCFLRPCKKRIHNYRNSYVKISMGFFNWIGYFFRVNYVSLLLNSTLCAYKVISIVVSIGIQYKSCLFSWSW